MADANTPQEPPPPSNMPADEGESAVPSASARFRLAARGAMNNAKASQSNSSLAAAVSAAAARAKAASGEGVDEPVDTTAVETPPPAGTPPPPPSSTTPSLSQMKSKAIYDIARTKIMTDRALYRLSSETGFIKLRSKPPPKLPGSGSTVASAPNGVHAKDAHPPSVHHPPAKGVAGWKEQGAIDSGKKAAPAPAQPSIFDTLSFYLEMVDRSGLWRNCAGVFGLMFFTYVLTTLNFGIFGLAIAATFGAQWYRNSIIRYRRTVKDDLQRAYERATITRTLESVGWMNEFVTRFWLMFEPSLSRMVIDMADPILEQNTPGFLDSLKLTTFTLGTKAPRIDGVRTYSELEDRNQIVMDWHASFTPNDLEDVPAVLRENRVNPKVVLTVRVGKGFIGAGMPILVENMVFKGKMQVKLQLGPVFPHVRTADVCFLERPTIDFSLKPVGGETLGFDIAHVPGLRTFILDTMHSIIGPMFYAPNHFTVDVEQIISGAVANIPAAKGVLVINMQSARGLPKMDTFGKADPYVRISTIKHPEIMVRTRTIEKTLAPSWGETLILLVYSKTDTIQFEVFDWNNVGKDDKIGFVSYPMQRLLEQPESEGNTMPIMMGETERGQLSFDMSYFPVSVRTTQAAAVDAEGNPLDPAAEAAAAAATQQDDTEISDEPDVESNTGLLRLFVRSASNLAMSPALARKLSVRAEAYINKTRVIECAEVKGTDAPSWEVGKEIFVPDRDCATIHLRLVNTANERTVGTLKLRIDEALAHQSGEAGSDWHALEGHVTGKVRLNVKWRPILMDPDVASSLGQGKKLPAPPIGFVKLTCHEGRGLKNVEGGTGRKSDPYTRVMVQNQVVAKTRYIANTLDPVWNETLFIPVHRINETLALECMDWNRVERDKPLGESMLKVSRLLGKPTVDEHGEPVYAKSEPVEMWAGLRQRNGKIKGEVRFRAAFVPVINFDEMLTEADRARGTLDMRLGDGGLVLGEEEPESKEDTSSSSAASEHGHANGNGNGIKVGGATPPVISQIKTNGSNMPREDRAAAPESIFSGTTGSGGDSMAQALGRYPRLPNIDYAQFRAGVLSVATIGCRGLVRPFAGVFVNVYLNGNRQAPIIETQPSRRRGREHMWENELAQAAVPEAPFDTLMFDVKCKPAGVDVDEMISIGRAEFTMAEMLAQKLVNTAEPVWLPLDADTGEVLVLLRFDPVEDPLLLPAESICDQGLVRVRIDSGSNLPAADKSGTSDPYVVALVDGVKVWESQTLKKTLNPRWNQHTEVGVRQRSKTVLVLEVYDWNQIQSHTLLGSTTIPLRDLPIDETVEKDYPLAAGLVSSSGARATLQLKFHFKPGYVEQHDDSSPVLLDVAHTVVKAPVTVIKGGASVVGNVVGGLFGKLGGMKNHLGTKQKTSSAGLSEESLVDSMGERKLSVAAAHALQNATNMPLDEDQQIVPAVEAAAAVVVPEADNRAATPQQQQLRPMPRLSESIDSFPTPGMLHVSIESAESHGASKRNLLVAVEMNHKTLHKTRVEKDATAPVAWDSERFSLPVLQGGLPQLSVAVKDHSSFRGDKTLAEFALNVFAELKPHLVETAGARASKLVVLESDAGAAHVRLEFVGRDSHGDDSAETASIAGGSIVGGRRGTGGEKHARRTSGFSRKSVK
ncbi:Tricalbin-2 [Coemansia furcata]|uniref:Tricalbin-2 n=1 Tax=Coemansia furcata TaxID=417177 RepID=A0ACC1LRY2_9FUNG|nr:Tricalbin-2 [Coemansia furcata]